MGWLGLQLQQLQLTLCLELAMSFELARFMCGAKNVFCLCPIDCFTGVAVAAVLLSLECVQSQLGSSVERTSLLKLPEVR